MIKDYLKQLKCLQQDRSLFHSQHTKHTLKRSLNRQEDKYQAYIIDQMNTQNRIIASNHLANALQPSIRAQQLLFFKQLTQTITKVQQQLPKQPEISEDICRSDNKIDKSEDNQTVEFFLVKLYTKQIIKSASKAQIYHKKQCFDRILEVSKRNNILHKIQKNLSRYAYRHALHNLKQIDRINQPNQDKLFFDSFSMIACQDRKKKIHDESVLNFMFQKENIQSVCELKETPKLRQELSYLKHLLAQKNIELKLQQQEIKKLKHISRQDLSQSIGSSNTSSYYSELQKEVLGGKRIKKNGSSRLEVTANRDKDQIEKELLGKYMRQSFQLKQSMDIVREMCLELQENVTSAGRKKIQEIVCVLNRGEEVSLLDEY